MAKGSNMKIYNSKQQVSAGQEMLAMSKPFLTINPTGSLRSPSMNSYRQTSGFPLSDEGNHTIISRIPAGGDKGSKTKRSVDFVNKEALEDPNLVRGVYFNS